MNEVQALRNLTTEELQSKLIDLRKKQLNLRISKVNGVLDKPHLITLARKSVARVKTILTERAGE